MNLKRIERHLSKIYKKNEDLRYQVLNADSKDKNGGYLIAINLHDYSEFWSADIKKVSDIDNLIK